MVFASKRAQRVVFATGLALGLLALGACSGGGGSISNPLPQPNQPSTPQGGLWQGTLSAAGMSVALPNVAGFSETMTFPANNAAAGTNLTVRVTSNSPAAMPKLDPDMHVAIPFLFFTIGTNKDVKLNGFPGFKMTIPAGFNMGNLPVKVGYYDPVGGWKHVGDFTLSGRTVTFTPTSTAVILKANVTYYAITYTCGGPSPSPTPTGVISCTASGTGAIAVLCVPAAGGGGKTYAFAGKGLASQDTVEQIDISGGAAGGGSHIIKTYTSGSSVHYTACSGDEKHLRVFCGAFSSGTMMDINGSAQTDSEFSSGASGSLSFSGGSCTICAIAFDPMDTAFILLTPSAAGGGAGSFQRLGESSHTVDMTIDSPDPNENPGYDYVKNWIFNPQYGGTKLETADFTKGKLFTTASGITGINTPDSACVDVATHVGNTGNEFTPPDTVTLADLGSATESGSTLTVTTGQTNLTHTGDQGLDIDACGTDSVIHVVFYAGEFGTNLMGFGLLPTTAGGTTISDWAFVQFPNTPDHATWRSAFDPHPIAAFNDPVNCPDCAISVNQGATWLAVIDLNKLTHAPRKSGDVHSIDPTYDLVANHVIAYYSI